MRTLTDTDRIVWLAARQAPKAISPWTLDDKAQLPALVGKALPSEIARRLGRAEEQVKVKLNQLGYSIPGDALAPIGISSTGLARRMSVGYFTVLDAILSRRLKASLLTVGASSIQWCQSVSITQGLKGKTVGALLHCNNAEARKPPVSGEVAH